MQHCLRRQRGGNEGGEGRRRARCISLSSLFHNEAAVSAWVCGRLSSTRKKEREREREGGGKKRNRERGKAVVVRSVGTRLPARSPRDLAPLAEFSTLAIDVT